MQNLGDKNTANIDHCISRVNEHAFTGPGNNLIKACAAGGCEWINHRFEIFLSPNIVEVVYLPYEVFSFNFESSIRIVVFVDV